MDTSYLTESQRSSVEYEGGNLFIEAGAGTGKTATLTAKVAYLMEKRNALAFEQICELLAITFTKKAAGELTGRIRAKLRSEGMASEALLVDGAWISTIHGMCERILKDHAFELGLDPAFEIAETHEIDELKRRAIIDAIEGKGGIRFDDRYDALFDEYVSRSSGPFSNTVNVADTLDKIIERVTMLPHGVEDLYLGPAPENPKTLVEKLLPAAQDALSALRGIDNPNDGTVKGIKRGEEIVSLLVAASEKNDPDDLSQTLAKVFEINPMANGNNQGGRAVKEILTPYKELTDSAADEFRQVLVWPFVGLFCDLALQVERLYQSYKHERALADNNDLLTLLYHAFDEHPDLVAQYADQFRLAMIDEFQDTDSLQVGIVDMLSGDERWRGQLVTVGDAQQSIYGFRGTEPALFRIFADRLPEGSAREMLDTNFRSHPDILAFVNSVFGAPEVFGEHYLRLEAPASRSKEPLPGGIPRVDMLMTTSQKNNKGYHQGVSSDMLAKIEATAIARRFKAFAETGAWDASQMVLLLGRMKQAKVYADALRAEGFEAVITGGSAFWQSPEAALIGAILRTLANPLDNEALYHVLSSSMLCLSSDELAALSYDDEGHYRPLYEGLCALGGTDDIANATESARIPFAAQLLSAALESVRTEAPTEIIERMLVDSGYIARLEQQGATGIAECANLKKALRYVKDIEEDELPGVAEVARGYTVTMENASADAPGALIAEGQRAVRIMTIHASKGLEFPIVALAEFDTLRNNGDKFIMRSVEGRAMLSLLPGRSCGNFSPKPRKYDGDTPISREDLENPALTRAEYHRMLVAYNEQEEIAERRRLFYVGATRAREALIVAVHPAHRSRGEFSLTPIQTDIARIFSDDETVASVFPLSDCEVDYGGTQPMRYTCQDFELNEAGELSFETHPELEPISYVADEASVELPVIAPSVPTTYLTREQICGVQDACEFSYTSIARAGGKDAALAGEDEAAFASSLAPVLPPDVTDDNDVVLPTHVRSDEEDGDATELGSAFHRIAEGMVVCGCLHDGEVVAPSPERIKTLIAPYRVTGAQMPRLRQALTTWVGSDIAQEAAGWSHLRAEAPFHLRFEAGEDAAPMPDVQRRYLMGAIDLLCTDESGKKALIVDYKTGGSPEETSDQLQKKHLLQAMCYAEAVFDAGIEEVDAAFVRVEQVAAGGQPQVVRYHFTHDQEPEIHAAIARGLLASEVNEGDS